MRLRTVAVLILPMALTSAGRPAAAAGVPNGEFDDLVNLGWNLEDPLASELAFAADHNACGDSRAVLVRVLPGAAGAEGRLVACVTDLVPGSSLDARVDVLVPAHQPGSGAARFALEWNTGTACDDAPDGSVSPPVTPAVAGVWVPQTIRAANVPATTHSARFVLITVRDTGGVPQDGVFDGAAVVTDGALFANGFENGTPCRWSAATGGVTTAPDTTITDGPAGAVAVDDATFAFVANQPGASFECRLDGTTWEPCASPAEVLDVADGSHVFEVRACVAAQCDPTPASHSWVVDTVAPETAILSGPTGVVGSGDASFTFAASPAAGTALTCALDNEPQVICSSPFGYVGLADGDHTFTVLACDEVGNCDPTPATRSWTIDTEKPLPPTLVSSMPPSPHTSAAPFLLGTAEADAAIRLYTSATCGGPLAGVGAADGDGNFAVQVLAGVGTTTFYADATDAAGNTSGCSGGFSYTRLP